MLLIKPGDTKDPLSDFFSDTCDSLILLILFDKATFDFLLFSVNEKWAPKKIIIIIMDSQATDDVKYMPYNVKDKTAHNSSS